MTDNNKIQANSIGDNKIQASLTDKWKQGKLPEGFYYVRCAWSDEVEIRYVHNGVDEWQEIVAEVPTFDEYQKLLSDQLAKNEGVEINAELEAENKELKELLDDCRIELYYWNDKDCELIVRINQVLADNKIQANTVACNKIQENE